MIKMESIFCLTQILGLTDGFVTNRTIPIEGNELSYQVRDLMPGASYQVQAYTVFDNRESLAYTSRNFTTSKLKNDNNFSVRTKNENNIENLKTRRKKRRAIN